MDGNIREMKRHRRLPALGTKSDSLTKLAHCVSLSMFPADSTNGTVGYRLGSPFALRLRKALYDDFPHWLLA